MIEKFEEVVGSFASTMDLFPVENITVIAGRNQQDGPISAIHPSAIDENLNQRIADVMGMGK